MTDRRKLQLEGTKDDSKPNQCIYHLVVESTSDLLPPTVVDEGTHPSKLFVSEA
jgi:hypothetical protein